MIYPDYSAIYRSGTPALALAASAEKALRLALEHQKQRTAHVKALNRYLRDELSKYPAVRFNGPENAVPHILNLIHVATRSWYHE